MHWSAMILLLGRDGLALDLGEGRARQDGVDRDAMGSKLAGERAGHAVKRGFRGDVVQVVRPPERHGARRHVDDPAEVRPPHGADHGPRAQERAGHVHPQHVLPLFERDLIERPHLDRREDRRIVDQNIDAAELSLNRLRHRGNRFRIGDVRRDCARTAACGRDLGRHGLAALAVAFRDHRNGALCGERLGKSAPDALAGAGDDRHAAVER
jgi:hypothetical protein